MVIISSGCLPLRELFGKAFKTKQMFISRDHCSCFPRNRIPIGTVVQ